MRVPSLRNSRLLAFWLFGLFVGASDPRAVAAGEIEVSTVHFRSAHPVAGGSGPWLEAAVALNANPAAGRMVSRVRVELILGFELPAAVGMPRRTDYYRATAECVALDAGRSDVRFYLPPELVKRDQLHGDPKFWSVALSVDGRPVPANRAHFAAALLDEAARKNFQTAALAAASANDGLLQPQYLTPFALEYPRATPTFVRREPPASR